METFNFGKYKGQSVENVISDNPEYVRWCVKNVSFFVLTADQAKQLSERFEVKERIRNRQTKKWLDSMYSEQEPYEGWGEDMRACFDPNY